MTRLGWVIACLVLLSSCASAPVAKIQYYLLTPISGQPAANAKEAMAHLRIRRVMVADYLKSRSLVMQRPNHQLYYSKGHLWSEDLQSGFAKAFASHMHNNTALLVTDWTTPKVSPSDYNVVIQLQHFLPTDKSEVLLSGRYWLYKGESEKQLISSQPFHYSTALQGDGYAQSVKQMSALVEQLAHQMQMHIHIQEVTTQ